MTKFPPYLKKGDTIGITCPAGYMAAEKAQTCIATLKAWGYKVVTGSTLGSQSATYFSGSDAERLKDFQQMLDDDNIKAILCGRGGYGASRIIDRLNWKHFKKNPKWIIGFSDITVLHSHLYTSLRTASMHAPMAAAFNDGEFKNEFIGSLKDALRGKKANYKIAAHSLNRHGLAGGELTGGNLTLTAHLIGSESEVSTRGKILFLEDIGEYLYSIDRLLTQLKRAGKFKGLAGLVLGGFTDLKDTDRPFGQSIEELVLDKVREYKYPVCFNFPVSHNKENYALKVGGRYSLKVSEKGVVLREEE